MKKINENKIQERIDYRILNIEQTFIQNSKQTCYFRKMVECPATVPMAELSFAA